MSNTIIIVGFGPGASSAVAEKFGAEGFSVALVARNEARLNAGVEALKAKGVPAGETTDVPANSDLCIASGKGNVPRAIVEAAQAPAFTVS